MEDNVYTYSRYFFNKFDKFYVYKNKEFFGILYVDEDEVKEIINDLNKKENINND